MQHKKILYSFEDFVTEITGKEVQYQKSVWYQHEECILVHPEDFEGLFHELCHWLVASESEKEDPNLTLVDSSMSEVYVEGKMRKAGKEFVENSIRREKQACFLEIDLLVETGLPFEKFEEVTEAGLTYDTKWYADLEKFEKAGYRSFLTKTLRRYSPDLRDTLRSYLKSYLEAYVETKR